MARLLVVEDSGELAALIAAAAGSRGHSTRTVFTGKAALEALEHERFDAALVDLELPDLPGTEVLAKLALKGVPAIAISGVHRGDHVADEATRVHGAKAFFEKPFPMATLLQAMEQLTDTPIQLGMEDEEPQVPEATPSPEELLEIDDEFAALAAQAAAEASPFEAGFRGALAAGGVPRLLLGLARSRDSGKVFLRSGVFTQVIELREGQPVSVESSDPEESFARFCVLRGRVPAEAVERIEPLLREGYTPAEALRQLSAISESDRAELEPMHLRAVLYAAFLWTEGEYALMRIPSSGTAVALGGGPLPCDFVFEGLLQPRSVETLREALPSERRLFPTPELGFAQHQVTLSSQQQRILELADGAKSIADLLVLAELPEAEALNLLLAFVQLGFLEVRAADVTQKRISFGL